MSSIQEKTWRCLVEVKLPGKKEWAEIVDPGEYALRRALEKCEIDGYRVFWVVTTTQSQIPSSSQ